MATTTPVDRSKRITNANAAFRKLIKNHMSTFLRVVINNGARGAAAYDMRR
jgi:uncharacterized ferritin-like protein (DUF455 family)